MTRVARPDVDVVDYEDLAAPFRPVFARIADGAVEREINRELPHAEVGWLRDAGFGAVRIPIADGGSGASISQFFRLLIELAEADSNLPQLWRAHFGFLEERLNGEDSDIRDHWLRAAVSGVVIGNAVTEVGGGAVGAVATSLEPSGDRWVLSGTKHYSTGAIFADWIVVSAQRGDETAWVLTPADAEGVTVSDNWDGFGQRLTGSGTTSLDGVLVDDEHVFPHTNRGPSYMIAFYQLVLLASLAGVARAALRDGVDYARSRKRVYSHGSGDLPREDPLVQQVIGKLSALSFAADATTLAAADTLETINRARSRGAIPSELFDVAEIAAARAQITVVDTVLQATTLLFEIGGASSVQESRRLDRHWRNARTISVHNPVIYKTRVVGDHELNATAPTYSWVVGVAR